MKIKFSLKEEGRLKTKDVKLVIFDLLGKELAIDGSELSSGIYFYQLHSADFIQTKKLILLK